jgi:hypothetical protein
MWGICFFERGRRIARLSLHNDLFRLSVLPCTSKHPLQLAVISENVIPSYKQQQNINNKKQQHQARELRSLTVVNRSNSNNANCYDNWRIHRSRRSLQQAKVCQSGKPSHQFHGTRQAVLFGAKVPLLEFSTSKGTCYVTASRIMFVETGIFFQTNLFDYSVVEFTRRGYCD